MNNWIIALSGVFGATGVVLGAVGSHVLKTQLSQQGFDLFNTAITYLLMHAVVLLLVGVIIGLYVENLWFKIAAGLFVVGIILFCGGLILRTTLNFTVLGSLAPIGGSALIFGWLALCVGGFANRGKP